MTSTSTSTPRSTRTWKAAAATGAAVALLAAGGATFAEWSDTSTLDNAATISSGTLALDETTGGTWTNARGTDVTAEVTNGAYRIVPGDSLSYAERLTVEATGDLLTATVSTNVPELSGNGSAELLQQLTADATMTLNGAPVENLTATVESSDQTQELDVVLTFAFDAATAGLLAQGQSVDLAALDVLLQQDTVADDS